MRFPLILLVGLLALSACTKPADQPAAAPVDTTAAVSSRPLTVADAATAPEFEPFRLALHRAAEAHDSAAVARIVADGIHWSFGADPSRRDAALKAWRLGDPKSPFWAAFRRMLAVGPAASKRDRELTKQLGADDATIFWTPWTQLAEPPPMEPPVEGKPPRWGEAMAVIDSAAAIRAKQDTTSRVLARPDPRSWVYTALGGGRPVSANNRPKFIRVFVPNSDQTGYIAASSVYSQYELRAQFVRKSGRWTMTVCIAGD